MAYSKEQQEGRAAATRRWRERNPAKAKALANAPKWVKARRDHAHAMKVTPLGRARSLLYDIKNRCAKKGMEMTLTVDWLHQRLVAGRCEVTGIPFRLHETKTAYVPSVDRIDPKKGYNPENCQVVVLMYNTAKGNWDHDTLMEMVRSLCQN